MKANDKIGLLTLIKKVPRPKDKKREGTYWQCQCECGKICIKHYKDLYDGSTKSCGCLKRRKPIYDKNEAIISNHAGIYGFQNIYNGKWYIGKTKNLYRRYLEHKHHTKEKEKQFYLALEKYGWESFNYYILKEYNQIPSEQELSKMEEFFIKDKDSYHHGYNATDISLGGFSSENHRQKCTEILNNLNEKQKGANHPRALFSEEQIRDIFNLAMRGCPFKIVWEKYQGITTMTKQSFHNLYTGRTYKNLLPDNWEARPAVTTNSILWGEDIIDIRTRLLRGEASKNIYEDYQEKCSWNVFKKVINNQTYKNIQPCID